MTTGGYVAFVRGEGPRVAGAPVKLVAVSPAMQAVVSMAQRGAGGTAKVLITGESGVGKDVLARFIHQQSPRAQGPFIAVNCAGVPESLLESELFGAFKGSFTGAVRDRVGHLQQADHGTLFLDEVGEMSLRMQAMLLRFIETGEVQRIGAEGPSFIDVRLIAATNRDLAQRVAAGEFREDLLYRLSVLHLHVPPLRERDEDLLPLIEVSLARMGHALTVSPDALRALHAYRWPGNVRELQNVLEQAAWRADAGTILPEHLPAALIGPPRIVAQKERRRQLADELYQALAGGGYSFWEHVHPLFLARDITRHDMRELVRRGLAATHGNYRALLALFGMPATDYKRFMNFLATHECTVDFRLFRGRDIAVSQPRPPLFPSGLAEGDTIAFDRELK